MEKLCKSQDELIMAMRRTLQYIVELGDHHQDCRNCRGMRFVAKKELERLYECYNFGEVDMVSERGCDC